MNWGQIQIESLKKMFLNKDDLEIEKINDYKKDKKYKTYLFSMIQACNEALTQIYAVKEPDIGIHNLIKNDAEMYDLSNLIDDYYNLVSIESPNNVKWQMKSANILNIKNWHSGDITIYYEKKHDYITSMTKDEYTLKLPIEYLNIIPLYIAGELYKDDDLTVSTMYLNEFNNMLNILTSKDNYISNNKIVPIYVID